MAKKLRIRFILICMLSLLAVMTVVLLSINLTNYAEVRNNADAILEELDNVGGDFFRDNRPDPQLPQLPDNTEPAPEMGPDARVPIDFDRRGGRFNAETPYETRYFSVSVADDGTFITDLDKIAAVDDANAVEMARQALDSGKQKGYVGVYRYRVTADGKMVLFVDCTKQLNTARVFLNTGLIVAAAVLLGMLLLIVLFSKRAVKPIVEAYERQRQFVTEASHELKTPITIISANNELLQLEYGDNESTDAIEHQVKRLSSMVKNMVSLSRLDEAESIECAECNLSDCVTEQIELYRNALIAGGRTLEADIADGIIVSGNVDLLAQLTSILLDNAIKYAATYTKVSLTRDKGVTLTVRNDAKGLSDGDKSRCFERFYRDVDVTKNIEGSGIGLAIAKQITTLHKGSIAASAKDGEFTIMFTL